MIDLVRLVVGVLILSIASYKDLKTRSVPVILWLIMGLSGLVILIYQILISQNYSLLYFIPLIFLAFIEWYIDLKKFSILINTVVFMMGFILLISSPNSSAFALFIIITLVLVAKLFYHTHILKGKADARALMSIAILVPYYPDTFKFFALPAVYRSVAQLTFPFTLEVLMNAAVLSFFLVVYFFFSNLIRRDIGIPEMFLGYKMPVISIPEKNVWLIEKINVHGTHYLDLKVTEERENLESDLNEFKKRGIKDAWVQPQIPFIFIMFLGFIIAYLMDDLALFFL